MIRVLVTGAGSATALAFLQAAEQPGVELYAADRDPWAPGLFLVPPERRVPLAGPGVEPLVAACERLRISVLVPTEPAELLALAERRGALERAGTQLLLPGPKAVAACLDREAGVRALARAVPTPRTARFLEAGASRGGAAEGFEPSAWPLPLVVRPRLVQGLGPTTVVRSMDALLRLPRGPEWIVQEHLPGRSYTVALVANARGTVKAAVPQTREGTPGRPQVQRVLRSRRLEVLAREVARRLGLRFGATVRLREDQHGRPRVVDVYPTLTSGLALSVAAGVDLPSLALKAALGLPIGPDEGRFQELAMVERAAPLFLDPARVAPLALSA